MKKISFHSVIFVALLFLYNPVTASTYFNSEGKQIDKVGYEKVIGTRTSMIQSTLLNGYGDQNSGLRDPVLLRKKRIEQWKAFNKVKGSE